MRNFPWQRWALCLAHALLLFALSWWLLNTHRVMDDEALLIKWSQVVKRTLLGLDDKPEDLKLLFIDVSQNKMLVPGTDDFGEPDELLSQALVNRQALAQLFTVMASAAPPRLVVCDVLFDIPSPHDAELETAIQGLGDRFLGVGTLGDNGELITPGIDIPYAIAAYAASQDMFLKYPVTLLDSLPTFPTQMFTLLDSATLSHRGPFAYLNQRLSLNAPIVEQRLRPIDFMPQDQMEGAGSYGRIALGHLLFLTQFYSEEELNELFGDVVVLVGDYVTDVHETSFGEISGTVIMVNAYLGLKAAEGRVRLAWLLFLLLGFTLVSYRMFYTVPLRNPRLRWWAESLLGRAFVSWLDYPIYLAVITLISYFLFHIHLSVFFLLLYIKGVEGLQTLWKWYVNRFGTKHVD